MPDFDAQGVALALRFTAANCPAPAGGYQAIRYATNYPAAAVGPLPCVLVFPTEGDLLTGGGKRESHETWLARFYFAETGTPEKDYKALQKWLGVLLDATKLSDQLGGTVAWARPMSWRIGALDYGDKRYSGIELTLHIEAHEAYSPTA